jgi:C1A family cysteine protease
LSEQYLISCNTEVWGCRGGFWAHDYHGNRVPPGELAAGAVYEGDFPYQAADVACNAPHAHHEQISSWSYVSIWGVPTVSAVKQAIQDHGPVAAGVCVGDAFANYGGGIFCTDESGACPYGSNHGVVLVGWDDGEGVWYLRNSWGRAWGENGYMRIAYGTSLVGADATYVVYGETAPAAPTATPLPAGPLTTVYLPLVLR